MNKKIISYFKCIFDMLSIIGFVCFGITLIYILTYINFSLLTTFEKFVFFSVFFLISLENIKIKLKEK